MTEREAPAPAALDWAALAVASMPGKPTAHQREQLFKHLASAVEPLLRRVAELEAKESALHDTRREAHLVLCKAGIRTHEFIGEGKTPTTGREIPLLERIEMLMFERDEARASRRRPRGSSRA